MKKIISLILALVMVFSFNVVSFADGDNVAPVPTYGEGVVLLPYTLPEGGTRGTFSGYASKYATYTHNGSFTVDVTGFPLLSAGLTFKTSCSSNDAACVIDIKRPNGGWMVQDLYFSANEEEAFTFYFPTTGTYTITYSAVVGSNSIQMQCWIYG